MVEAYSPVPEHVAFRKAAVCVTGSRFARNKGREFRLPTDEGEKVISTGVIRGGFLRHIQSVNVFVRDFQPQDIQGATELYPFQRISLHTSSQHDPSINVDNPMLVTLIDVATREVGSSRINFPTFPTRETHTEREIASRIEETRAGLNTPSEDDLRKASELLGRIDTRNDRIDPLSGQTWRELRQAGMRRTLLGWQ